MTTFQAVVWIGLALLLLPVVAYTVGHNSFLRLIIFVGGAMLVMQSGDGIGVAKLSYLCAAAFCVMVSLARLPRLRRLPWWRPFRPALIGSFILFTMIVVVAVGSVIGGEDSARVARDAVTYLLISAAPLVGLDAASEWSPKSASLAVVIFTVVGGIGFAVQWLAQRNVSTLGVDHLVMSSMMLVGLGVSAGVVYGLTPKFRGRWLAFALFALGSVLVTGTRTGLILLLAPVVGVGNRLKYRIRPIALIVGLFAVGVTSFLLLPLVLPVIASESFFSSRVSSLLTVLDRGVSEDASGAIRLRAYSYAADIWHRSPLFGVGFGHSFANPNPRTANADFQLDTPILYLAKFGVFGTLVIVVALICFAVTARQIRRTLGIYSPEQTISRIFVAMWVLVLPFGTPTEDKGFALGLCLLFFMMGSRVSKEVSIDGWSFLTSTPRPKMDFGRPSSF